ncbi:unnamed protein product [Durusdinium trenchii]|uniref:hydroxymethylglutaryl-CoA lyase n=1 Tax=Durusdinium trenchii TaxID=1381693 RepID=A0ABP0RSV5_9DINO
MKKLVKEFVREMVKGKEMNVLRADGSHMSVKCGLTRSLDTLRIKSGAETRHLSLNEVEKVLQGAPEELSDLETPLDEACATLVLQNECISFKFMEQEKAELFTLKYRGYILCESKAGSADGLEEHPKLAFPVLVPNAKGLQAALDAGAKEVTLLAAASDTFAKKNTNCTVEENLERAAVALQVAAASQCHVRAAISVCLGCPYEGEVPAQRVAQVASRLLEGGCQEVVICDTIGTGTAASVRKVLEAVEGAGIPIDRVGVHFHDTYGQAVANTLAALQFGVAKVDAAVGGVGGCPFAGPGASGNAATEDILQLLQGLEVETGLNFSKLAETGEWLTSHILQKGNGSKAGPATLRQRRPAPQRSVDSPRRPLDGVRVLEVGPGLVAGGWTGATLAYFGAEVVKVEPPEVGDGIRKWRILDSQTQTSLWWQSIARNKRSLALDLRQPKGRELLKKLTGHADVLVENFKPGTLERWGMAPETLRQENPGLIVARVSGYGQTGPKSRGCNLGGHLICRHVVTLSCSDYSWFTHCFEHSQSQLAWVVAV